METECKQKRSFRKSERGQTMLEFALMLPFMLLLGVGIVEIGRAIFYTIAVNNAATAGVEYGSQNGTTASDTSGMQNAATSDANFSAMTAVATHGCTCDNGGGTTAESCTYPVPAPSTCSAAIESTCSGTIVECVQVNTTATFSPIFNYPGLPSSYTANGKAVMRVRQ